MRTICHTSGTDRYFSASARKSVISDLLAEGLILIEGGPPTNYSAWSPDVLGCVATGDSIEEVKREMREALALHLQGMEEDGLPLPEATGPGAYVAA